jgi:pyruvate formate lyase activating enzyme
MEELSQTGVVFNVQKYSLQDGPGIRTTVFLKGCPLCCSWCHNPEGLSPRPEIVVVETRCAVCGECRTACPLPGALQATVPLPTQNPDCLFCAACVEACPGGARQLIGRTMTVAEVLRQVLQDRIFYDDSGGGVTFSGGEPLMQPGFLKALLAACHDHGVHAAVDTCGLAASQHLLEIAPLTGLFLYDLKLMDDARHQLHTGVSNRPILENLRRLSAVHANIWVRVPLIPGINDDPENLEAMARFVSSIPSARQVSVLPFHKTGAQKFRRLGRAFGLEQLEPPTPQAVAAAVEQLRSSGVMVKAGA